MAEKKRISAASARTHTRGKKGSSKGKEGGLSLLPRQLLLVALAVGFAGVIYLYFVPPAPTVVGTPGGPPVTAPRIRLSDGRYLAYHEGGVPKERAKAFAVTLHGFTGCRTDLYPASKEVFEKFGLYLVSFDRPGYGESDPHPGRTAKSAAQDVDELAAALNLGDKFYIISTSMGGMTAWGCLKYIQHRIAGVAMEAPVINFWWNGFPANVAKEGWDTQYWNDKLVLSITHHLPWLQYWWMAQKIFPTSSAVPGRERRLMGTDIKVLQLLRERGGFGPRLKNNTVQGVHESLNRDLLVSFGKWHFSPLDLHNPFIPVHVWQGDEDYLVPVVLQRYIASQLPWIDYHELPKHGHILQFVPGVADQIVTTLLSDKMEDREIDK